MGFALPMLELRPHPVFAIGATGHRDLSPIKQHLSEMECCLESILRSVRQAQSEVVAANIEFFAEKTPAVKLLTMGADGADLLISRVARAQGLPIGCVLPLARNLYRHDFSDEAWREAENLIASADSCLELPGTRAEGARAYERANDVILANIDLLLAIWDGDRARSRAGTGDVVQSAVDLGIPVIVIDFLNPSKSGLMEPSRRLSFDPIAATDRARIPLDPFPAELVSSLFCPPRIQSQRSSFTELLSETGGHVWRFEYPLLFRVFGVSSAANRRSGDGLNPLVSEDEKRRFVDSLAIRYARLYRSSIVGIYAYVMIGSWIAALFGLMFPKLSGIAIVFQIVANLVILLDAYRRKKGRWHEKWLDYRVVAERLRWLRFLHQFGLGDGALAQGTSGRQVGWTDWYVRRLAREIGPPSGMIDDQKIEAMTQFLKEYEIRAQIAYHRTNFRQLATLEARLALAANIPIALTVLIAAALAIAAMHTGSLSEIGWKPLAMLLLATLPTTKAALSGILSSGDFVRIIERSAITKAMLFRMRRSLDAADVSYDSVRIAILRLAAVMSNELAEWRQVLNNRQQRQSFKRHGSNSVWRQIRRRLFGARTTS
jgi:hypothetical protein